MQIFGIILAAIFGLLFGNYTTTAFYRIPIGKPLNGLSDSLGLKPHCSHCGHKLEFYEYLPVLSWISTKFKCNYCGAKTDMMYTFLESGCMFISVALYLYLDFSNAYIIALLISALSLLTIALYIRHSRLYKRIIAAIFLFATLYFVSQ